MTLVVAQEGITSRKFRGSARDRVILFLNNNVSGATIAKTIVPELIEKGVEPVLFLLDTPDLPKSQIPELVDFSLYEGKIVELITPFLNLSQSGHGFAPANQNVPQHLRDLADKHHLELYHEADVNASADLTKLLASDQILGGISIRNLQIFKQATIDAFKDKNAFLWNIHSGDLPEYRGVHPMLRAMADGRKTSGWTLHVITRGIDKGPIIKSSHGPIDTETPYMTQFFDKLPEASEIIIEAVKEYRRTGSIMLMHNDVSAGKYYSFPTACELKQWEQRGIVLVDPRDMMRFYMDLLANGDPQKAELVGNAVQGTIQMIEFLNTRNAPYRSYAAG